MQCQSLGVGHLGLHGKWCDQGFSGTFSSAIFFSNTEESLGIGDDFNN